MELKLSAKELDIHHKHEQLSVLNDEFEQSEEKIKLLESNVTKLNQMTEKWKKGNSLDDNTLMQLHRWKWIIGYISKKIFPFQASLEYQL